MLDAHQHFWTVERDDYGWLTPDLKPLFRDFGPTDLAPLMRQAGINRTILVQAAETEAETDYCLRLARETDFVAGVVGWLDMLSDSFVSRLDYYQAQPKWIGLRPMLQGHDPAMIADPAFRAALSEVARRDIPFDILTFPRHLPAIREALAATPGLRGIIDHISKPDMTNPDMGDWASHMSAIGALPNIFCKISGLVTEAGADWTIDRIRPFVRHVAGAFGPDRLVFGTDWPVSTLAATHEEVVDLAKNLLGELFGPEDLAKIFEANAVRFYKLPA
ncbi:L-fuconolactonase [Rhizobium sp. RU20A]|uniref:amidohydrolase family protein n=1 Tax=Rhizobium sp. RU20A TaxID=1907412 RepID=UPI000957419E|nr:amidohydrolase family protein [Rhizobium sp. RU20A]SIR32948.1 L-fuconolactonase [Rhizobium sp. RU20A]